MKTALPLLALAAVATLLLYSCKKTSNAPAATTATTDTLFTVTALNSPEAGQIFLSLDNASNGVLFVLDQNGLIRKRLSLGPTVANLEKWTVNGQVRYTYSQSDANGFKIPGVSNLPGYEVVCDSNFNVLQRIQLSSYGTLNTSEQKDIDGHDFILIDDNHYITETYYEKTVNNIPSSLNPASTVTVAAIIIQEVQNGSVIWQWDGTNYPEFYTTSVEGNGFSDSTVVADYMHLNSMYIDPRDNNLICSFRNMDQVIKINRQTGAIVWRLGGSNSDFPITSDQQFLRQHCVTLTDSNQTLLVFDDGEATQRPSTRILEFKLDETGHTITSYKAFAVPEPFTGYEGSVQKRGDTYFIGGGTANYVLEVNYTTGQKLLEIQQKETSYRALKY